MDQPWQLFSSLQMHFYKVCFILFYWIVLVRWISLKTVMSWIPRIFYVLHCILYLIYCQPFSLYPKCNNWRLMASSLCGWNVFGNFLHRLIQWQILERITLFQPLILLLINAQTISAPLFFTINFKLLGSDHSFCMQASLWFLTKNLLFITRNSYL